MVLSSAKKCTGTATLIPRSNEKCFLIHSGIPLNSANPHRPKAFRLARVEGCWDFLPAKPTPVYIAKLEVSSCFWYLHLPPLWRHIFRVQVGDVCYSWTHLPFGWAYVPILCQSVVSTLVRAALIGIIILLLLYLDDVLLAGTERDVAKGSARVVDLTKPVFA